jgi:hypothetical protein
MKKPTLNKQLLIDKAADLIRLFKRYGFPIFLVFVGLIYGFVLLRVNILSNTQPSDAAVSSQVKAAAIPNIDQDVISQLQSLQDNSVSVKALFNQARSNPFQ